MVELPPQDERLSLTFLVVGASVSGLSCAYGLHINGHKAHVIERGSGVYQTEAGIRVPPNFSRLINLVPGMEEFLEKECTTATGISYIQGKTGETLGVMEHKADLMSDLASEFYMVPYDAYCNRLREVCEGLGVKFSFNTTVSSIETSLDESPVIITSTGERLTGDIVVGADGSESIVRKYMVDDRSTEKRKMRYHTTISTPIARIKDDPEMKSLIESQALNVWLGTGTCVTGGRYGPDLYHISMTESDPVEHKHWQCKGPADFPEMAREYEPRIHKLINLSHCHQKTSQTIREVVDYSDPRRRLALVGDATKCVPWHGAHNSAAAVEDLVTLACLFSYLTKREDIPVILEGYTRIRVPRNNILQNAELGALDMISMVGPETEGRDRALAASADPNVNDEEWLSTVWDQYLEMYNYDARDAADEWWHQWGQFADRLNVEADAEDVSEDGSEAS